MSREAKLERYNFINNLSCIVKGLENEYTTIDLQNESCLTGRIKHVDGCMNVDLEDVIYYNPMGKKYVFETFFVSSRLIRYVHIPKHLSADKIIQNQMKGLVYAPSKTKDNYKIVRAKRYQKDIVKSLATETSSVQ